MLAFDAIENYSVSPFHGHFHAQLTVVGACQAEGQQLVFLVV